MASYPLREYMGIVSGELWWGGGIVSGELWWGLRTGQALSLRVRVTGAGAGTGTGMTVVAVWVLYPANCGGG